MAEYAAGRTPNPCLRCNEKIKFAAVLDRGRRARLRRRRHRPLRAAADGDDGRSRCTARSTRARTSPTCSACSTQEQLAHSLFPLGDIPQAAGARARPRGAACRSPTSPTATTSASSPTATPRAGCGADSACGTGRDRRPRRRRGARQPRRRAPASPSASARACGSAAGRRRPAALRAGHRAGLRAPSPSAPRASSPCDRIDGIRPRWCGAAPDGRWHGTVQLRAHGAPHRPLIGRRARRRSSCCCDAAARHRARVRPRSLRRRPGVGSATIAAHGPALMTGVTGVGSLPGTDYRAALRTVLDALGGAELPDLPYLPELPARGPGPP